MTAHLNKMELQMYMILGVENSWFHIRVHETRRWVKQNPYKAAGGLFAWTAAFTGLCTFLYQTGVTGFSALGLLEGTITVGKILLTSASTALCIGILAIGIAYFVWQWKEESCIGVTRAEKYMQDVHRMVALIEHLPNDAFDNQLDHMIAASDKLINELPIGEDQKCRICLKEGKDVIAPVRAPRCDSHHYMCKSHWQDYIQHPCGRKKSCPVCRR